MFLLVKLRDNYFLDIDFLRIRKTRGSGAAKACKENLVIPGTRIGNVPTYWNHTNNKSRTVDISTTEDLILFTTAEAYDRIFFRRRNQTPMTQHPGAKMNNLLRNLKIRNLKFDLVQTQDDYFKKPLSKEDSNSRSAMDTDYNDNGPNNNSKYDESSTMASLNHTNNGDSHLDSSSTGISSNSIQR